MAHKTRTTPRTADGWHSVKDSMIYVEKGMAIRAMKKGRDGIQMIPADIFFFDARYETWMPVRSVRFETVRNGIYRGTYMVGRCRPQTLYHFSVFVLQLNIIIYVFYLKRMSGASTITSAESTRLRDLGISPLCVREADGQPIAVVSQTGIDTAIGNTIPGRFVCYGAGDWIGLLISDDGQIRCVTGLSEQSAYRVALGMEIGRRKHPHRYVSKGIPDRKPRL